MTKNYFKFVLILFYIFNFNILNAEITLSFVGDVMTGSDYPDRSYLPSNEGKDIFKSVESYFKNSDINFANLEGAIANTNTQSAKRSKNSYSFRMPPYMANRIAEAGFNIVAVANNHSRDFGDKGYKQTQEYVQNAGIKIIGNILNTASFIEVKNKKIGFLAFYYFSYANNSIQDIVFLSLVFMAELKAEICIEFQKLRKCFTAKIEAMFINSQER